MLHLKDQVWSKIDDATRLLITSDEHPEYGVTEVSILTMPSKTVICMPSQTNCNLGCKFCHLTGTTRSVKCYDHKFLADLIRFSITISGQANRDILISFMGAGEPIYNYDYILTACLIVREEYKSIRFAMATTMPDSKMFINFAYLVNSHKLNMKVHLSLHGFESRKEMMHDNVDAMRCIHLMELYRRVTGNDIEYHYALVDGVNDTDEELERLKNAITEYTTVKFITLNPLNGLEASEKRDVIEEKLGLNKLINVEFYTPPGRDIGSSCGQFDRDLYNEVE